VRYFRVHSINRGLLSLEEIREDGEVIGLPVSLPPGTMLKGEDGQTWIVLRQVEKSVGLNRHGARAGFRFSLGEKARA
jgi:hypothetical protein